MPYAPVNEAGHVLYYEDSGTPPNATSEYTTIVVIHGFVFHSGIFRPLLALAPTHGLRLVLLNTRDYPESSPFTAEEASAFSSVHPQVQEHAIRDLGRQIASFLVHFLRQKDVPKVQTNRDGKQTGGIALLSWSLGNLIAMSLLGNIHTLPQDTKDLLTRYWRKLVMYDPSLTTIGEAPPVGVYSPLRDTSLSLHDRGQLFATWVSSYWPSVSSLLSEYTVSDLLARQKLAETPEYKNTLPPSKRLSTVERMSEEELGQTTDFGIIHRSTETMRFVPRYIYQENVRRALWEPEADSEKKMTFPDLKVYILWFSMTMGDCVWAIKLLADRLSQEDRKEGCTRRRDIEIDSVEGANHFAHWDEPERIIRLLAERV